LAYLRPIERSKTELLHVGRKLKEPSEQAIQCYRLKFLKGDDWTQEAIGKRIYGKVGMQSRVSRDLKAVKIWIAAGNVLPEMKEGPTPKAFSVDPRNLDAGPRRVRRQPSE
jgi:hypothetical protein